MDRRSLAALILINAVLLAALVVTVAPRSAQAQFGVNPSNYMMIAGSIRGRDNQNAIYIVDRQSSQVIALTFNSNTNRFELFDMRRISDDAGFDSGR